MVSEQAVLIQKNGILTKKELVEAISPLSDDTPVLIRVDELRGGAEQIAVVNGKILISDEGV